MPKPLTILLEGESDRAAVVALAPRFGVDFDAEQITLTVIGGAGNFGRAISEATAQGHRVAGLYDEQEERFVANALNRQEGEDLSRQGFFACRPDLELELVRAIGAAEMNPLLESAGEWKTFRNFADQPAYRDHDAVEQLRRYIGANGARKAKFATLMGEAVPFESVPEPLEGLLNWIWGA